MSLDASRGLKVPAKEVIGMRAQQQPATRIRVIVDPSSLYFLHFKLLSTTSCARLFNLSRSPYQTITVPHNNNNNKQYIMGLFWSKGIGGRHFGTSIHVDKNGVRRGPWRFSLGKFSCFRA